MTLVWVLYDIIENKIRNKVAKTCKNKGLYRFQNSAFQGNLTFNEMDALALECEQLLDLDKDSLYIFPMDNESFKKVKLLGQAFDKKLVKDEVYTLFF